jgi:hypothetical protein
MSMSYKELLQKREGQGARVGGRVWLDRSRRFSRPWHQILGTQVCQQSGR